MNIRQAILKAANSIEQYPELFHFSSIDNPDISCGTSGCALGWVRLHLHGQKETQTISETAKELGINTAIPEFIFYDRMKSFDVSWRRNAKTCAITLRLYADKYHSDHIPESVREIFKEVVYVDREIRDAKF